LSQLSSSPFDRLTYDFLARTGSFDWCTAWMHTSEAIGDTASTRELVAVLTEKKVHGEALPGGLNRLLVERIKVADTVIPCLGVSPDIGSG
jgi:hypothetical protein